MPDLDSRAEQGASGLYAPGPARWLTCREPPADPISEAELSLIWEGQRFPTGALATPAGEIVEVVFPGHRGGAAGPDFRDAVLRLAGSERRGDVELHVRASYFRGHGHHLDPAYDRLALHVVYLADDGAETRLCSGGATPVAAFAPWLQQRQADLQRWLESPPLWREPCAEAVARRGEPTVIDALREAGAERFRARVAALRQQTALVGAAEALWRSLIEGLSYGGDRVGFERLARAFPAVLARDLLARGGRQSLEEALLTVAGLAPARERDPGLPPPLKPALGGRSGRPGNRPERRLTALACLTERAAGDLPAYARCSLNGGAGVDEMLAAWQVGGLVGTERAAELLLNAVLPFCATEPELEGAALTLVAALPAQRPYGKTGFLERNLRRPDGRRLVRAALHQQGLLGLLADWCSQGGCGRCPLS
jgi:hypothetical protein